MRKKGRNHDDITPKPLLSYFEFFIFFLNPRGVGGGKVIIQGVF